MNLTERLLERLYELGYEVEENEHEALLRAIDKAQFSIMNTLNSEGVPRELEYVWIDMAAGEYLLAANEKADEGVKTISEGDMTVSFKDEDPQDELIDRLLNNGRCEMLSYRRVKW